MRSSILASLVAATLVVACSGPQRASAGATTGNASPPVAAVRPIELEKHGHIRVDEYFWLRERDDPAVTAYLEAENEYAAAALAHTEELQARLFDEIVGRIAGDDESVPYEEDGWWYYTRYVEGGEYPLHCRKSSLDSHDEAVLLDGNSLGAGHSYFAIGGFSVSSDDRVIAYSTDIVGRRKYDIRFRALRTREAIPDTLTGVTGNMAWAADGRTLFYGRQDPDTLRAYQIWRHELGTDPANDVLVFQEDDDTFSCSVQRTKSKRFLLITSSHSTTSEVRYLDAAEPRGEFRSVLPRRKGHRYRVDHFGEHFYVWTNDAAPNGRLVRMPIERRAASAWEEVVAHRDDALLEGFEIFRDHLVLTERVDGLRSLRVRPWNGDPEHSIRFDESTYTVRPGDNRSFDTPWLRFVYTSMTTPSSTYDYRMDTRERVLRKRERVLGDFDPENYVTERHFATARDGERVPISLVYRRGFERSGDAPLLLSGYGSYGSSRDATFNSALLSLLDRGFAYAIAHVRGGREMGERWYEQGKLFNKKNTFTDFIDCAEHLVRERFTSPQHLYAQGGSAGGLLMGAVMNLRPDLFHGVVANVPFVDVVTTMLDASIPLTTFEYDEWGDPNRPDYYDYMLSYSPYDQVAEKSYPNLLVTSGLHDSQVQYWEPAKWVARLRARGTGDQLIVFRTNMAAGHGGASGRFRRYEETAYSYAFLLHLEDADR